MLFSITLNPPFKVSLRCKGKFFPVFTLRRKCFKIKVANIKKYIMLISLVRAKAIMFSEVDKDTSIKGWGLAYEG